MFQPNHRTATGRYAAWDNFVCFERILLHPRPQKLARGTSGRDRCKGRGRPWDWFESLLVPRFRFCSRLLPNLATKPYLRLVGARELAGQFIMKSERILKSRNISTYTPTLGHHRARARSFLLLFRLLTFAAVRYLSDGALWHRSLADVQSTSVVKAAGPSLVEWSVATPGSHKHGSKQKFYELCGSMLNKILQFQLSHPNRTSLPLQSSIL